MHPISKHVCDIIDRSIEKSINEKTYNYAHAKTENIEIIHAVFRIRRNKDDMRMPPAADFKLTFIDDRDMIFSFNLSHVNRVTDRHVKGLCNKSQKYYNNNKLMIDELNALYYQSSKVGIQSLLSNELNLFNAKEFDVEKESAYVLEEVKKYSQLINDFITMDKV